MVVRSKIMCIVGPLLVLGCNGPVATDTTSGLPVKLQMVDTVHAIKKPLLLIQPTEDTIHVAAEKIVGQLLQALAYNKMLPELRGYTKKVDFTPSGDGVAVSDSIITYSTAHNTFTYLKSGNPTAPGATLVRCRIGYMPNSLTKNVRLGMSKAELSRVLTTPFASSVLLVSEEEGYQKFFFAFKNNLLQKLEFQSDYID